MTLESAINIAWDLMRRSPAQRRTEADSGGSLEDPDELQAGLQLADRGVLPQSAARTSWPARERRMELS